MSTNIYVYRETVWYEIKPSHKWGWYISTSSDGKGIATLDNKNVANALVKTVLKEMAAVGLEATHTSGYEGEMEACFVLSQAQGGEDQDWFHEVITGIAPKRTDLWTFLMDLAEGPKIHCIINS